MFGWFIGLSSDQLKHFNFIHTHSPSTYELREEVKTGGGGGLIIILDFYLFVKKMNLIDHDF